MTDQENKARNRRLVEQGFSTGDTAVLDELVAADCVDHGAPPGWPAGLEGVRQFMAMMRGAFPDLRYEIEDQIAEGDKVLTRVTWRGTHRGEFMGMPATGKQVAVAGMDLTRWSNGKAVEHWGVQDALGMLQQLGKIPAPGGAAG
jgi:steroid delta-isomerase-like uncharacterized protein